MTVLQILDIVLPFEPEDNCNRKRAKKIERRKEIRVRIENYLAGHNIDFSDITNPEFLPALNSLK